MKCRTKHRSRLPAFHIALYLLLGYSGAVAVAGPVQQTTGRIVSKHVLLRIPLEREWLGRETITDLETCYIFMDKTTGGSLPAKVLVNISWNEPASEIHPGEATITIGMNNPAAAADSRRYLLHQAAKEMARLGLLELSKEGAGRAESRFILEGMAEILACEYGHSSRNLNAAWVRCYLMNGMEPLSLSKLASWDRFSDGRQDQRAAAPGITFLLTCREMSGRKSLLKLFQSMSQKDLPESLAAAFKSTAAELESAWLEKIRAHRVAEDSTATSDEDAPNLERTVLDPATGVPGQELQIRVTIRDRSGDLSPHAVFLEERESGRVLSAQNPPEAGGRYLGFRFAIPQDRKPGSYDYRVIAVDEAGNARIWPGAYPVVSR
jgi:hypothetical protein